MQSVLAFFFLVFTAGALSAEPSLKACDGQSEPVEQPENSVIACPDATGGFAILKPQPCPNNGGADGVCGITKEWCQAHPHCALWQVSECEAVDARQQMPMTAAGLKIMRDYCRSDPVMCKQKGIDIELRCLGR